LPLTKRWLLWTRELVAAFCKLLKSRKIYDRIVFCGFTDSALLEGSALQNAQDVLPLASKFFLIPANISGPWSIFAIYHD